MKRAGYDKKVITAFMLIITALFIIKFIELQYAGRAISEPVINSALNLEKGNGIVTNIWLEGNAKLDNLRTRGMKYLIVDVGDTASNGKLKTSQEEIKSFLDFIHSYEERNNYSFILLPYSEINTYNYEIDSPEFLQNMINDYKMLVVMGFDGAFVDIEPIKFSQREKYLKFLEELSVTFDDDIIIAVYAGHLGSSFYNEWEWNSEYYLKVGNRVDLISVPGYDLDFTTASDYKKDIRNKVKKLNSLGLNSKLMLGVPTHKQSPETILNALSAFNSEITLQSNLQQMKNNFIGVAVFAEWTTSPQEWEIIRTHSPRL